MSKFLDELKNIIEGEIRSDPVSLQVYSVDASIFEITPQCIVLPKHKKDILNTLKIAQKYNIPLSCRGAATGITGGCLGTGIILDVSKYLNRCLEIDISNHFAIVEPGLIQDDLNDHLHSFGYRLGPDTSTGNRATLGGMLANNAAGARSLRFGKMSDHIEAVELVLVNGYVINFSEITNEEWEKKRILDNFEGHIYETLWQLKQKYSKEIEEKFPHIPRRVSGYNLDELLNPKGINVAKIIAGSEGTLGIISKMKLKIVTTIAHSALCLLYFDDLISSFKAVPDILEFHPLSLELIDDQIIQLGKNVPSMKGKLEWIQDDPQAILICEFDGSTEEEIKKKLENFYSKIQNNHFGYKKQIVTDPITIQNIWALRKAGLGILLSKRTYSRAIAFIEDISISPLVLADFMQKFCDYLKKKNKWAGIYGHVGSGCMHIRPYIDLRNPEELRLMREMMNDITELIVSYKGALSGEHGDGYIRSWLNPKLFGDALYDAFVELKNAFDPQNILNPGKIVHAKPPFEPLRLSPEMPIKKIETFLNFNRENGFELAVDLCNGNGECRKKTGVMCPSFQVTNEEFHSTRARAQTLRSIIHGKLPIQELTEKGTYAVMDLCLSCKGCKTECPSQVDMAKMKSEFLYHYQQKNGYSIRTKLFSYIDFINKMSSPFASILNYFYKTKLFKQLASHIGIAHERNLPQLAEKTFSSLFKNFEQPKNLQKQVVLFIDTFTEYNEPQIGMAAVKFLNTAGYHVIIPPRICCGRPAFTKGMLEVAKEKAQKMVEALYPFVEKGLPIVGLEPSCILTISDDYPSLFSESLKNKLSLISDNSFTFAQFVAQYIDFNLLTFKPLNKTTKCFIHGHCHQKALLGMKDSLKVIRSIPNYEVIEIPSGCCGMAGSFGYEQEHYSISMKIGELKLFPFILKEPEEVIIIADGTSCRHQIKDGTGRRALHSAEVLLHALALE